MADVLEIARLLDTLISNVHALIEESEQAALQGEDDQLKRMALRGELMGLVLAKEIVLRT